MPKPEHTCCKCHPTNKRSRNCPGCAHEAAVEAVLKEVEIHLKAAWPLIHGPDADVRVRSILDNVRERVK